ncbi:MAG: sigma-70 family RNA polymerase sigma factor [Verrucomicrobiae bacterium]|nr:sigma-70 family RNA polymerase sigma factor [Verrucomicrobiae bacterium]
MTAPEVDELDVRDMRLLAQGHDAALNDLVERHAGRLFQYLVRCLQNEDDASDLAQETFARVYAHRLAYDPRRRFSTWLYAIASNLVKDHYRWRSRHPTVSIEENVGHSDRGSDSAGVLSYHEFNAAGMTFGVLFTDWRDSSEELAWAQSQLDGNGGIPTILVSHEILAPNSANPSVPNESNHGLLLWQELINENDQVFMSINGHNQGTAWRVQQNAFGNEVLQMVVDYQFTPFNGAGYLRELVFDTDADKIYASTFVAVDRSRSMDMVAGYEGGCAPRWRSSSAG